MYVRLGCSDICYCDFRLHKKIVSFLYAHIYEVYFNQYNVYSFCSLFTPYQEVMDMSLFFPSLMGMSSTLLP